MNFADFFEIPRIASIIKQHKFKRVALQFPEESLRFSHLVFHALTKEIRRNSSFFHTLNGKNVDFSQEEGVNSNFYGGSALNLSSSVVDQCRKEATTAEGCTDNPSEDGVTTFSSSSKQYPKSTVKSCFFEDSRDEGVNIKGQTQPPIVQGEDNALCSVVKSKSEGTELQAHKAKDSSSSSSSFLEDKKIHFPAEDEAFIFVLGDNTYGSCCIDTLGCLQNNADCIVHFGHSCQTEVEEALKGRAFNQKPPAILLVFDKGFLELEGFTSTIRTHTQNEAPKDSKTVLVHDDGLHYRLLEIVARIGPLFLPHDAPSSSNSNSLASHTHKTHESSPLASCASTLFHPSSYQSSENDEKPLPPPSSSHGENFISLSDGFVETSLIITMPWLHGPNIVEDEVHTHMVSLSKGEGVCKEQNLAVFEYNSFSLSGDAHTTRSETPTSLPSHKTHTTESKAPTSFPSHKTHTSIPPDVEVEGFTIPCLPSALERAAFPVLSSAPPASAVRTAGKEDVCVCNRRLAKVYVNPHSGSIRIEQIKEVLAKEKKAWSFIYVGPKYMLGGEDFAADSEGCVHEDEGSEASEDTCAHKKTLNADKKTGAALNEGNQASKDIHTHRAALDANQKTPPTAPPRNKPRLPSWLEGDDFLLLSMEGGILTSKHRCKGGNSSAEGIFRGSNSTQYYPLFERLLLRYGSDSPVYAFDTSSYSVNDLKLVSRVRAAASSSPSRAAGGAEGRVQRNGEREERRGREEGEEQVSAQQTHPPFHLSNKTSSSPSALLPKPSTPQLLTHNESQHTPPPQVTPTPPSLQTSLPTPTPSPPPLHREEQLVDRLILRRFSKLKMVESARKIGLINGILSASHHLRLGKKMRRFLADSDKVAYSLAVGKLNIAKIENFPEIDVFCLLSCPERTFIYDRDVMKKIVTPYELMVGLGLLEWNTQYLLDFEEILRALAERKNWSLYPVNMEDEEGNSTGNYPVSSAHTAKDLEDLLPAAPPKHPLKTPQSSRASADSSRIKEDEHTHMVGKPPLTLHKRGEEQMRVMQKIASLSLIDVGKRTFRGVDPTFNTEAPSVVIEGLDGIASFYRSESHYNTL